MAFICLGLNESKETIIQNILEWQVYDITAYNASDLMMASHL